MIWGQTLKVEYGIHENFIKGHHTLTKFEVTTRLNDARPAKPFGRVVGQEALRIEYLILQGISSNISSSPSMEYLESVTYSKLVLAPVQGPYAVSCDSI